MKQNLITVRRNLFEVTHSFSPALAPGLLFCLGLLFCFSCVGHFSTVGNAVAASQPKNTVKTAAASKVTKSVASTKSIAVIGGVLTNQENQIPELPSYTDPVMETTIEEEETPL